MTASSLRSEDLARLRRAVQLLEEDGLMVRITAMLGGVVELGGGWVARMLPKGAEALIADAAQAALVKALDAALLTVDRKGSGVTGWGWLDRGLASRAFDASLAMLSGAGGGFGGLGTTLAELPITTTIILRGIVGSALREGEDLADDATRLECLKVFALGSPSHAGEADAGYFATRFALNEAVHKLAGRSLADVLPKFLVERISPRFAAAVGTKVAAQAVPVLSAGVGALLNLVFIDHFQNKAEGHFTLRRLERAYGAEAIRTAYDELRQEREAAQAMRRKAAAAQP